MSKFKLKLAIAIITILVLPLSAHSSNQEGVADEVNSTSEQVVMNTPDIIEEIKRIWQEITGRNIGRTIEEILSVIGLGNPADESSRVGAGEDKNNPYANPVTPEEVHDLERHTDIVRSQMPQKLSQVIFSPKGQEMMAEETTKVEAIQIVSHQAQQASNIVYQESIKIAQAGKTHADKITTLREEARSASASQNVLKAISAQNDDLAQILAGNSHQLAQLGEIGLYQSVQLNGLNAQLTSLNEKAQVLEVLVSSQNYLMSQVNGALDRQKEYQQYRDSLKNGLDRNMSQMVFIPGLYKKCTLPGACTNAAVESSH